MDIVHEADKRGWISKSSNVKRFVEEWNYKLNRNALFEHGSFLTENMFKEIDSTFSLEVCPEVAEYEYSRFLEIPEDVELVTLIVQKIELNKRNSSVKYDKQVYQHFRNYNFPPHQMVGAENVEDIPFEPVDEPEVALTVQIYRPEKKATPYDRKFLSRLPCFKIESNFMVLGNQYLCELRDKIECLSDKVIPFELSDFPDMEISTTCKDLYKSGFFYIEGVVYNDMRDPDCRDYSEPVIQWSKTGTDVMEMQKGSMENTKFKDLKLRLGYPYLYNHQGNCEHLLVFSDMRLLSDEDVKNKNAYPMLVTARHNKRIFCMVCKIFDARWVVFNNPRLPETPFMFCKKCYVGFNYDSNKQKIGQFKAYRFIDPPAVMNA
ncbi:snRNA-activating protein complex subunit 3-like isoform X1 [Uloborus diversus]|uniref:snRNA-activating protein complex subunit 3-like isoform X1 n=1 Tax=Uloborus diversus TaxID=327109 RepID=UPI00240A5322|nr:snRNA-activating protein complex subunit 3-like isoform X1 [Uloborus diversus]